MKLHDCVPVTMGIPSRVVCEDCGHNANCQIHGGPTLCRSWRTPCEVDDD